MKLKFEHDSAKWGHNFTAAPICRRLVRLADVVRAASPAGRAHAVGLPLKRAVCWVLDALAKDPASQLFLLDQVEEPSQVCESNVWRPGIPSGMEQLKATYPELLESLNQAAACRRVVATDADFLADIKANAGDCGDLMLAAGLVYIDREEYARRDALHRLSESCQFVDLKDYAALPAVRELAGVEGLMDWLRIQWVDRLKTSADLDTGLASFVAIPAELVAGMPWVQPAAERPVLALVTASVIEGQDSRIVQPAGGLWSNHKEGARWSDVEKSAMRKMRANGLTDTEIAAAVKCKRQVVGQQIGSKQADRARQTTERVNGQLQA